MKKKILKTLGVLIFLHAGILSAHAGTNSPEIIQSIEIENQLPERRPDIFAIIRMKAGDEFSLDKLENAINDLRKWGVFKKVEVLVKHEGKKVSLTFDLEDAYLVRDIIINGNYPLLETKVKRAIFFATGDIYEHEKITEQIDRLIEFYEKEGYRNTVVFIEERLNPSTRTVVLKINIHKGHSYRIDQIHIVGNTIFKDNRIKNKIGQFFDYKPSRVKKDLEDIQKLFRNHDHPRVRVKLVKVDYNEKKHTVDLTIQIREGKEVEVVFEGNEHQFDRSLRKVVDIVQNGDYDEFELEHSKNQLITHYRSKGYENTKVDVIKNEISKDKVLVTFKIEEGPHRIIKSIDFEGNEHIPAKKIRSIMLTKEESLGNRGVFIEEVFKQDLEKIETFFEDNGFIDAKIKEWKRSLIPTGDKYIIDIELDEGKQSLVEKLSFEGLQLFGPDELKKLLLVKEARPYSPARLEQDMRALLVYYSNHAHPYAEIKTDIEEVAPQKVNIKYRVKEGPEVSIGEILFVGNVLTHKKTILQALRFKAGGPFLPQKILESQTWLRRLGIFDAIILETLGLKGKEKVVHVVIRVEEKKNKVFDFGIGFDTETRFKARATYSLLNIGGTGKGIDFKITGGQRINRAEIVFNDPRLFGSDWQMVDNIFAQFERKPFFQDLQAGGAVGVIRNITRRLSVLLKYELARTDFVEEKTDFRLLRPGTHDNTTGKFQFSITYDTRDNFGDPRSGIYTYGRTDFGTEFQGGGSQFFKLTSRFGHWWSPFHRFTIANALRGIFVVPLNNRSVPTQELIFLGGDDTIRGFQNDALNPAGGKVAFIHNVELQFRLFKGFELVGFLDTASLTNDLGEISTSTFRHSAGPGLRYVTPVGPIRLDYGIILDPRPGENHTRLHFTFGYFF